MASGFSANSENRYQETNGVNPDSESTEDENRENRKMKTQVEKNARSETVNGVEEQHGDGFDFTNPDVLIEQLEKIDLTEEDTEELLHEAYKVNMKLKEILRRQESKRRDRMSSAKSAYSTGSKSGRSHGSSVLPPIQRKSAATAHLHSGSKSSSSSNMSRDSAKRRTEDSKRPKRSSTSTSTREKPAWDDRFSYS